MFRIKQRSVIYFTIIIILLPIQMVNSSYGNKINCIIENEGLDNNKSLFDIYHISELHSSEDRLPSFISDNINHLAHSERVESSLEPLDLMDSPWPMYCHDERHTGRSNYSTVGNPSGVEKWRLYDGWGVYR